MKKEGNGNGKAHGELYSPDHAVDVKTDTHTNNQTHLYAPHNALHINNKEVCYCYLSIYHYGTSIFLIIITIWIDDRQVEEGEAKNKKEEEDDVEKRNPKCSSKL